VTGKVPGPLGVPFALDRGGPESLAVQLAAALRTAAATGAFQVGDRLPSTRTLARELALSRAVTAAAYEQLLAEGWVTGRRGSGTYVSAAPPAVAEHDPRLPPGDRPRRGGPGRWPVDLRAGGPCVHVLDAAAWRRAWRAGADAPPDREPDSLGLPEYRSAVLEHLLRHRGLLAGPEVVLATGGSTSAVAELAHVLPPGARVAVEEPGYQRARWALEAAGLTVVPAPLDDAGLVVAALPPRTAAVYCTPAHQYPMGARLPAERRVALVHRARREGFLVIEDDYDGELRYDVAPLPLLAALGPDVVVHLGTASKLLTPTLGAGWLVAPPRVAAAVLDRRERTGARPARAGQRLFATLAAHGDLARHLRRLRRELAIRRAMTVGAVSAAGFGVRGDRAGAHLVVDLPDLAAERAVSSAAASWGVLVDGLERHFAGTPTAAGIVLGYAGPARAELEHALPRVTAALAAAA